jgi:hypothetical protein
LKKGFPLKIPFLKLLKVFGRWPGRNPFEKGFLPKSIPRMLTLNDIACLKDT